MSLAALIARLGVAEVARRAGVTQATVLRWARTGVSKSGEAALARVIAAHQRSRKAAQTVAAKFQAGIADPPETELPPAVVKPSRPPTKRDKQQSLKKAGGLGSLIAAPPKPGGRRYQSESYQTDRYVGERTWLHYSLPLPEVPVDELIEAAESVWFGSDRSMCQVTLMLFRYVPVNPAYGPNHHLFKKQGSWIPQWASTEHLTQSHSWDATRRALASHIEFLFGPGTSREWGKTMGLSGQAETRVLWLESVCVKTFDERGGYGSKPLRKGRK